MANAQALDSSAAAGVEASLNSEADDSDETELRAALAYAASWAMPGSRRADGFNGPRWTHRWGARLELRGSGGSGTEPIELEQRAEIAVFVGSVGQVIRLHQPYRLTDRVVRREAPKVSAGAFVDFPGFGPARVRNRMNVEGFPFLIEMSEHFGDTRGQTIHVETAAVRVADGEMDIRLFSNRIDIHDFDDAVAGSLQSAFITFDSVPASEFKGIGNFSDKWRVSFRAGLSLVVPFLKTQHYLLDAPTGSVAPHLLLRVARLGSRSPRLRRSAIGRPLIDSSDIGLELATLHRHVDGTGIDAGGQLRTWMRVPIGDAVTAYGEGIVGTGIRHLVVGDDGKWRAGDDSLWLARAEAGVDVPVANRFHASLSGYSERSDLRGVMVWSGGAYAGLRAEL